MNRRWWVAVGCVAGVVGALTVDSLFLAVGPIAGVMAYAGVWS